MARTTITPTVLNADGGVPTAAGTAATGFTQVSTGAGNGVTFSNIPGQTLLMLGGTTNGTCTVLIGQTVLGQAITSFTVPVTLTPFAPLAVIGPFHSVLDAVGSANVSVDFTFANTVPFAGVAQIPGVY